MKIVLIQLADKAGEVAVLKMLGQNGFGKAFVLHEPSGCCFTWQSVSQTGSNLKHDKTVPVIAPPHHRRICRIFQHSLYRALAKFPVHPMEIPTCRAFGPKHYLINFVVGVLRQRQREGQLTKSLELFAPMAPIP